jgi:hypothetical protein
MNTWKQSPGTSKLRCRLRVIGLAAAFAVAVPATAGTIYRCTDASGKITYTVKKCGANGTAGVEKAVEYPDAPPVLARPVKPAAAPAAAAALPGKRRVAAMRFFYDPADAPREHSTEKMESLIRSAIVAWSAGCSVELDYAGTGPYVAAGTPERVGIRWSEELMRARHPSDAAFGMGGTGSLEGGVSLRQRVSDDSLAHVIVHEIGHVLGVRHMHEDGKSVMSYLPDKDALNNVQPSSSDFLACNRAMKKRFGLDLTLPPEVPEKTMSDEEALDRRRSIK